MKKRLAAGSWLVWVALIFVVVGLTRIASTLATSKGTIADDNARAVTVGIVVLAMFVLGMQFVSLPGAMLARTLRNRYPSALVACGRMNPTVKALLRRRIMNSDPDMSRIPYLNFGFIADRFGMQFWTGTKNPTQLIAIEWSSVMSIELADTNLGPSKQTSLSFSFASGESPLIFSVARNSLLGTSVMDKDSVEKLLEDIVLLKGA